MLSTPAADAPAPPAPAVPSDQGTRPTVPRWRRVVVALLVILGCMLAPLSAVSVWLRNTLLDTEQYVDTVAPLAADPAVQAAVADVVAAQAEANVDIRSAVRGALPPQAGFIAPFVAEGFDRFVGEVALRFVQSAEFETLWREANRRAHKGLVAVLEGRGTETVETRDGKVVVNLSPVTQKVLERLKSLGAGIFDSVSGQPVPRQLVLFESESLTKAQSAVELLDTLAWALPILTLVSFAGAIALSPDRRRTVLRSAVGVVVAMALLLTAFNLGRAAYLDAVKAVNRDAAAAVYDQMLRFLRLSARTVFALGLVTALGAWLAGPGRYATLTRGTVAGMARGSGDAEVTAVGTFVGQYRTLLRVLAIGLGVVLLVLLNRPRPPAVLLIALLVVAGLLLVEFLGRGAPRRGEEA